MAKPHIQQMALKERQTLIDTERKARATAERLEVSRGVSETVALSEARGQAFVIPKASRTPRAAPVRRVSGLMWLHTRKRLTDAQFAAGMKYGACYRAAKTDARIRSILDDTVRGEARDMAWKTYLEHLEKPAQARAMLERYRQWISVQQLIDTCDQICGEERTPREAAANGRGAEVIEALLTVALDLLARGDK